jgi:hypothetical protein
MMELHLVLKLLFLVMMELDAPRTFATKHPENAFTLSTRPILPAENARILLAAKQSIFQTTSIPNARTPSTTQQPKDAISFNSMELLVEQTVLQKPLFAIALLLDLAILHSVSMEFADTTKRLVTMELDAPRTLAMLSLESALTL